MVFRMLEEEGHAGLRRHRELVEGVVRVGILEGCLATLKAVVEIDQSGEVASFAIVAFPGKVLVSVELLARIVAVEAK